MGARGKFITLEGIDCSGKTTLIPKIAKYLTDKGYEVIVTKDPGGCYASSKIREIVLGYEIVPIPRLLLYIAARMQLVHEVIQPAIFAGKVVISDRFTDSTYAYQGAGDGLKADVEFLFDKYPCPVVPDLTLLLDITLDTAVDRLKARGKFEPADIMDNQSQEFKRRVREYYLSNTAKHVERVALINANGTIDDTWANVKAAIDKKFPPKAV